MTTKPKSLSPRAQSLLDTFDDAAKRYGYEADQGTSAAEVMKSHDTYLKAKQDLVTYIQRVSRRKS